MVTGDYVCARVGGARGVSVAIGGLVVVGDLVGRWVEVGS